MEGGCYCGALRYEVKGKPVFKAQCHCRACTHFAGGAPNLFMAMPANGFSYTKGTPSQFTRDKEAPATRDFCPICGTQVASHRKGMPLVMIKVGTLDDPALFKAPKAAIFVAEKQPFHEIPEDLACFEGFPMAAE